MLDSGFIRGGFAAEYDARIIPGQNHPIVHAIAAATGTDRRPKIDVELQSDGQNPWICSFEGVDERCSLFTTPDPLTVGLATNDSYVLYLITVPSHCIDEIPVSTPAACATSDFENSRLFVATDIDVIGIGKSGLLWRSRRVSLDGIAMLTYSDGRVRGVGTRTGGSSIAFSIDAASGDAAGGFDFRPLGPGLWFAP